MGTKQAMLAVVLTVVLAAPAWADFEDGLAAFYFRDYATALLEWRPLAEQGHGKAQNNLGLMYAKGRGVTQDFTAAVKWYRLSAEQGYATAQYNLGLMYYTSQGVSQDYTEAAKWYRKAADQGHTKAQLNLGCAPRLRAGVHVAQPHRRGRVARRRPGRGGKGPGHN